MERMGKNAQLNSVNTQKLAKEMFYAFWIIMTLVKALGFYEGQRVYTLGIGISFLCIVVKMVLEKRTRRENMMMALLLVLGAVIYFCSTEKTPLILIFLVIGMEGIDVKKTFRIGLGIWSVCFLMMATLEILGLRYGAFVVHEKLGLGPVIRWSLGYTHPNVLQITYSVIAVLILFLSEKKGIEQLKLLILLFLGNLWVFLYAVSYTGFIMGTGALVLCFYFDNLARFSRIERGLIYLFIPGCVTLSIVIPYLCGEGMPLRPLDGILNKLLNTRPRCVQVYLKQGLHLFGASFTSEQVGNFALDSSFATLLIRDGVIFFLLVILAYMGMTVYYVKHRMRKELFLLLSLSLAGITEPFLFNTSFKNMTMVLMGAWVWTMLAKYRRKEMADANAETGLPESDCTGQEGIEKETADAIGVFDISGILSARKRVPQKIRWGLILAAVLIGILSGILRYAAWEKPEYIYVSTDIRDEISNPDMVCVTDPAAEIAAGNPVYGWPGADVPMGRYSGNLILLEQIRGAAGYAALGMAWSLILLEGCVTIVYLSRGEKKV